MYKLQVSVRSSIRMFVRINSDNNQTDRRRLIEFSCDYADGWTNYHDVQRGTSSWNCLCIIFV